MNEIQKKLLDMMKCFHDFCNENDLRYYAVGGTALGAVRHKGFIPWDDDLDVGMPRADYERFKSLSDVMNKNGRYVVEFPLQKEDSIYPFCKIYDTETTLVENARNKVKRGLYIDVFPLDGIGNSLEDGIQNFKKINFWKILFNTKNCGIRKGRSFVKNCAVIFGRMIPDFVISRQKLIVKLNELGKQRVYDDYDYAVNIFGAWNEKEVVQRAWLGVPQLCAFEDTYIYIPENADKYLQSLYGDYMKLPPEEKRISHHDYVECDINKGYIHK